jgi:aminoglycoside 3-N-acetyltransferase
MCYIPFREALQSLEIKKGDILYVSSDIKRLLILMLKNEKIFDPNLIIDTLQNIVGTEGTLLFPTFNWDFCKGLPFDYSNTPSKTGSLSKTALQRKDFKRTKHPIYSFAVWGRYQDFLCSLENTDSFGLGSPFDFVYKQHGINFIIDVDYQNCFTFVHYVEEAVGVTYRYIKEFTSTYIDKDLNITPKTYSMYVRDLELETEININPIGEVFEARKIAKKKIINGLPFILINLNQAFDIVKDDILNNRSKKVALYKGQ